MIGHGPNRDSRWQKWMLQSVSKETHGIECPSLLMKFEMIDNRLMIMTQDPPCVKKKLKNPLLSSTCQDRFWNKSWNKYLAHKNCLLLVVEVLSKEEHGLLEDDIKTNKIYLLCYVWPSLKWGHVCNALTKGYQCILVSICNSHVKGTIFHL